MTPLSRATQAAKAFLLSALICPRRESTPASSRYCSSSLRASGWSRYLSLPQQSRIRASSSGLHSLSQRRWSMPLVTLVNLSGVRA
ncbi:Uncharacterised protein [Flavonifractor plautii]|uniref:Uncharacterized protein n=1 Tax=Flavonifractor plautii TaxID=292800 RepID=A0A174S7E6_FLAPL|nr:Uncharacterised protein [Flavonifractor plautii]